MDRPPNDISPQDLARLTVETFVSLGTVIMSPPDPKGVLATRAGAFVSLRLADGELRGCIGTIEPTRTHVGEEIIHNAVSAATRDPRFAPVSPNELAGMKYGVDVLSPPEPARGIEDLDPTIYGVIVETTDGTRRGVLLPRIEGVASAEEQWHAVHSKAGIKLGTPVRVERFTVTRYGKD